VPRPQSSQPKDKNFGIFLQDGNKDLPPRGRGEVSRQESVFSGVKENPKSPLKGDTFNEMRRA